MHTKAQTYACCNAHEPNFVNVKALCLKSTPTLYEIYMHLVKAEHKNM